MSEIKVGDYVQRSTEAQTSDCWEAFLKLNPTGPYLVTEVSFGWLGLNNFKWRSDSGPFARANFYIVPAQPPAPQPVLGPFQLLVGGELLEGTYTSIIDAEKAAKLAVTVHAPVTIIRNVAVVSASIVPEVNYV